MTTTKQDMDIPLNDYDKTEGIPSAFLNVEVAETDRRSIRQN